MAEHQPVGGPDAAQTQECLWLTHSMVAWPVLHQATYLSSFLYSVERWLLGHIQIQPEQENPHGLPGCGDLSWV